MRKFVLCFAIVIFSSVFLFSASETGRIGAQIGLGFIGGGIGYMIGTANACCVSCVSSIGDPDLEDLSFISGVMTTGGFAGTILGGSAGVFFSGNMMVEENVTIENPWETFFGTMGGGILSCTAGYLLDFTMHKVRNEESVRPGSFYVLGLMLSPIAETFAYHQFVEESETSTSAGSSAFIRNFETNSSNTKILQFSLSF
jgi:MFS family permease